MERSAVQRWVDELFDSWKTGDAARAASLFSVDAVYRSHPFRDPARGRSEIADYWQQASQTQTAMDLHVGSPIVDGDRVAVEWWVSLTENGIDSVSTGTLFLTFGDGLCTSLREVWTEEPGRMAPYPGWGR